MKLNSHYIRTLIRSKGYSQNEAGKEIGFDSSSISQYLNNHVTPPWQFIVSLARVLCVSIESLIDYEDLALSEERAPYGEQGLLPVIGKASSIEAGLLDLIVQPPLGQYPFPLAGSSGSFVVIVDDDSMAPAYPEKTFVMVSPQLQFANGLPHLVIYKDGIKQRSLFRIVYQNNCANHIIYNCLSYQFNVHKPILIHGSDIITIARAAWHSTPED